MNLVTTVEVSSTGTRYRLTDGTLHREGEDCPAFHYIDIDPPNLDVEEFHLFGLHVATRITPTSEEVGEEDFMFATPIDLIAYGDLFFSVEEQQRSSLEVAEALLEGLMRKGNNKGMLIVVNTMKVHFPGEGEKIAKFEKLIEVIETSNVFIRTNDLTRHESLYAPAQHYRTRKIE